MTWTSERITLPTIYDSNGNLLPCSGGTVVAKGLRQASRGLKIKLFDGQNVRPDFIFIDDPQDETIACSPTQVGKLRQRIKKSLLGSAGHHGSLSVVMNCTVIDTDDLAETFLSHEKEPAWQGQRTPFVLKFPKANDTLWLNDYGRIRSDYNASDIHDQFRARKAAMEFYQQNREEMDEGGEVA